MLCSCVLCVCALNVCALIVCGASPRTPAGCSALETVEIGSLSFNYMEQHVFNLTGERPACADEGRGVSRRASPVALAAAVGTLI